MKLYNAATGIPDAVRQRVKGLRLSLIWTRHAQEEAAHDKYGILSLECYPDRFAMEQGWTLVEVETSLLDDVTKFVVRRPADDTRSLVLVIRPGDYDKCSGRVVTCWTNLNTDNHRSLDKTKFSK